MEPSQRGRRLLVAAGAGPLRAGGEDRRCRERHIRSDALDIYVFDQVREALLRPEVLMAGESAVMARGPLPTMSCWVSSPPASDVGQSRLRSKDGD